VPSNGCAPSIAAHRQARRPCSEPEDSFLRRGYGAKAPDRLTDT
jgi:hypothetical protein